MFSRVCASLAAQLQWSSFTSHQAKASWSAFAFAEAGRGAAQRQYVALYYLFNPFTRSEAGPPGCTLSEFGQDPYGGR